jgi:hypothetical protein
MRPLRLYQHVFLSGAMRLIFNRTGYTPCEAKGAAFVALEAELRANADLPRHGWRLVQQTDITHTLTIVSRH